MSTPAMVPCPDCGTPARATGQSFCDSCGAFLRWTAPAGGRPAPSAADKAPPATGSASESAPAPADEPDHHPEPAREHSGRSIAPDAPTPPAGTPVFVPDPAGPAQPAAPAGRPDAVTVPTPAVSDEAHDTTPVPEVRTTSASEAARALLVPVEEASASRPREAPGTVLPGRPEAARPQVRPSAPAPAPENGAPCPACSTPNHQHRTFCRSCATPLGPRRQDNATGPYAGQRPPLHRDRKRWIARALVALVVVGLIVGGVFGGPPAARAVQDHFAKRVAVHPTSWTASHWDPKHAPGLAGDSYSNTWWGSGYAGDAQGTYLEATFGQPTDLLALLITPGTSKRAGQQSEQARPQEFDLVVTDTSGKQHVSHRSINDGGVQRIDVRVRDAASVRIILRSAFGTAKDKQVAIAEVEFFARSKN
ncbi:zinc ribbon domain-containing protein [Streptomyces sp. NBC_00083]|uniref:NADase-type glycan-binding domain-containing protein n=1 Tax=Streptomyces sp. NBC_00083 TaxID=2975647 RepID=UPI00224F8C4B|nr:zinc ribbon domain-containing protein [Streptomyces sp. NBC_00083]MCX5388285.1 zinc ribbon domain-containing protein [Streptomyces sp. NBC_00083]